MTSYIVSFILGFILPFASGRFGKVLPADPGTVCVQLFHRPRRPQGTPERMKIWRHKWHVLFLRALGWGILFMALAFAAHTYLPDSSFWWFMAFFGMIGLCILIDEAFFLLPDFITLPLLLVGFLASFYEVVLPMQEALVGACFGYLVSVVAVIIGHFVLKQAVFGAGDVKLLTALGAWLGSQGLSATLLVSFGLFAVRAAYTRRSDGPFGPALGLAAVLLLFYLYGK